MPKKILAVDDERNLVRLIEVHLTREGYQVMTAFDGLEALQKVEAERPDLVVLDVMMPHMDGFEVLQRLKADPATADIPVLMLTAKAQDADVLRGYQTGVDLYLTKPFSPRELLTFVKRVFESQSGQVEERIEVSSDRDPEVQTSVSAVNRLVPELTEADATTVTDFLTVAARSIEDALLQSGAQPGADYSYLDLFNLAMPLVIESWKRDRLVLTR